jgi:hypothetical protein
VNELLAEVTERLDFFVLGLSLALLTHEAVLLVTGHLDEGVLRQFCTGIDVQV